ncbi:MAG: hypothetical protein JRN33_02985 [Nitrososphaerota archaeon]|jgi:hypothetical protein|nr:hypothetical protein [Nitrososphaerota archaeon]
MPYPPLASRGNAGLFSGRGARNISLILFELANRSPVSTWDLAKALTADDQTYQEVKKKEAVVFRIILGRQRLSARSPGLVDRGYVALSSARAYRGKKVALYSPTLKGLVAAICLNQSALPASKLAGWVSRFASTHLVYHLLQKLADDGQEALVELFHYSLADYFSRGLLNLELVDDQLVCEGMLYVLRRILVDSEERNGTESASSARRTFGRLLQEHQASGYWYKIDNATMVETISLFCFSERV